MRPVWARRAVALIVGSSLLALGAAGCESPDAPRTKTISLSGPTQRQRMKADRMRRAGRFDEAIELYQSLLEEPTQDPRFDAELRHEAGLAYWGRAGDPEATTQTRAADQAAAIQCARQALAKLEAQADTYSAGLSRKVSLSLGSYLRARGDLDEALDLYSRLLTDVAEPSVDRIRVLHELGNTYLERGGRRGDDPPTGAGHREALAAVMQRQEQALALAGQVEDCPPVLLAGVHNSLGLIHHQRSQPGPAAEHFGRAERICAEHAEPDQHTEVLLNLVLALVDAGRYDDVRARCDELKASPDAAANPRTIALLGFAALKLGDFGDAMQQFDLARLAAGQDPACRNDLTFLAQLAVNTATCAQAIGAYDEAERRLIEARQQLEAGGVDPRTSAVIKANLGRMYLTLERLDEAEAQLEEVLQVVRDLEGSEHPDAMLLLLDLGNLARLRGYVVEARKRYQDALQGLTAAWGEDHPQVAQARLELASLQRDQGQCAEALTQTSQAMEVLDAVLGPDHKQSVLACLQATLIAADCHDSPEGAAQFDKLADEAAKRFRQLRATLGSKNVEVLAALATFADVNARTPAAYAHALERYREAEEGFLEVYGDGVLSLADVRLRHGKLLEKMDRQDEALRLYDRAARSIDRSLRQHPTRAALLAAMGDIFKAKGDLEQARPLWQEALTILRATYGSDHPRVRQFREQRRE
ncbi:MAG: tetratricopeptide repeat protein [Planctomycetota bacterium]